MEGAPRVEVHEHFDAAGNPTGYTRVTHEPRVTEDDRAQILALSEYDNSLCPCGCGQTIEEAADDKRAFKIGSFRCYARRAIEAERRRQREEADRLDKPDGWDDGLSFYVQDSGHWTPKPTKGGGFLRVDTPPGSGPSPAPGAPGTPVTSRRQPASAQPDRPTKPRQHRQPSRQA